MAELNDLLIRIDATTEQLRKELKSATGAVDASASKMDRSLGRIDTGFNRLGRAAGAAKLALGAVFSAAVVRSASRFVTSQLEAADAIGKAAQTADVGVERLQELRFAFGQLAGTSGKDVDLALQRFNRRLGLAAAGSKEYADALKRLGVSAKTETGPALEQALRQIAQIENAAERSAVASELFGEEAGPRLAGALAGGISKVDELAAAIRSEGGIISDKQVKQAEAFNDEMDKLRKVLTAQTAGVVLENADSYRALAEALGSVAANAVGALGSLANLGRRLGRAAFNFEQRVTGGADGIGDVGLPDGIAPPVSQSASRAPLAVVTKGRPPIDVGPSFSTSSADPGRALRDLKEFNAALEEGARITEKARTPLESYNAQVQKLLDLHRVGAITDETYSRSVQAAAEELRRSIDDFQDPFEDVREGIETSLIDGITDGADGMRRVWDDLLADLTRKFLRSQVSDLLANLSTGGGSGLLGSIGSLFGGGRASGGPVMPGKFYQVGEKGPELFAPRVPGTIIPNGASGGLKVTIQNNAPNVDVSARQNPAGELEVFVESIVGRMVGDGGLGRQLAAAGMPVPRRGVR